MRSELPPRNRKFATILLNNLLVLQHSEKGRRQFEGLRNKPGETEGGAVLGHWHGADMGRRQKRLRLNGELLRGLTGAMLS